MGEIVLFFLAIIIYLSMKYESSQKKLKEAEREIKINKDSEKMILNDKLNRVTYFYLKKTELGYELLEAWDEDYEDIAFYIKQNNLNFIQDEDSLMYMSSTFHFSDIENIYYYDTLIYNKFYGRNYIIIPYDNVTVIDDRIEVILFRLDNKNKIDELNNFININKVPTKYIKSRDDFTDDDVKVSTCLFSKPTKMTKLYSREYI